MKDNDLHFDRSCHVLYSKPCKKEIRAKIALHYQKPGERLLGKGAAAICGFLSGLAYRFGRQTELNNGAGSTMTVSPL